MSKVIIILLIIIICLASFSIGYILHESKDQLEIIQEAQKIIIDKQTFNISDSNISICGDEVYGR